MEMEPDSPQMSLGLTVLRCSTTLFTLCKNEVEPMQPVSRWVQWSMPLPCRPSMRSPATRNKRLLSGTNVERRENIDINEYIIVPKQSSSGGYVKNLHKKDQRKTRKLSFPYRMIEQLLLLLLHHTITTLPDRVSPSCLSSSTWPLITLQPVWLENCTELMVSTSKPST